MRLGFTAATASSGVVNVRPGRTVTRRRGCARTGVTTSGLAHTARKVGTSELASRRALVAS